MTALRRTRRRPARGRRPDRRRRVLFGLLLAAVAVCAFATGKAFTASNTVPPTNIGQFARAISPAELAPAECAANGITVTSIVGGSGTVTSTAANQLVLGSSGADTLNDGGAGTACMVGGAGSDTFNGLNKAGDLCVVSSITPPASIKKCQVVATRP